MKKESTSAKVQVDRPPLLSCRSDLGLLGLAIGDTGRFVTGDKQAKGGENEQGGHESVKFRQAYLYRHLGSGI